MHGPMNVKFEKHVTTTEETVCYCYRMVTVTVTVMVPLEKISRSQPFHIMCILI